MKSTFLFGLLFSINAFSFPNPLFVPFDNVTQFGQYVSKNSESIIDSTAKLAEANYPGFHYFLVTRKMTLNTYDEKVDDAKLPFATLEMSSNDLKCERDVYSLLSSDSLGENRELTFSLAPTLRCQGIKKDPIRQ